MKKFETPVVEIVKFAIDDIMTASSGPNDPNAGEEDEF